MPYKHSGEIGDVWKHLPLCDVLKIESPDRYFETNSAYADYALITTPQNQYGVFKLLGQRLNGHLEESAYLKILKKIGADNKNVYYGSPALAVTMLNNDEVEFYFHDIEKESLENIVKFSKKNNIQNRVKTICGDSISIFLSNDYCFSHNDFVFIDPYMPFDGNKSGHTFFDIFKKVYTSHAKTMLWYGYDNLNGKNRIIGELQDISHKLNEGIIHTFDVWQKCMKQDSCKINPGVPGCGIAVSNLSPTSIARIEEYLNNIFDLYSNAIYDGENASLCIGHLAL